MGRDTVRRGRGVLVGEGRVTFCQVLSALRTSLCFSVRQRHRRRLQPVGVLGARARSHKLPVNRNMTSMTALAALWMK
jgi:hypothetical protein